MAGAVGIHDHPTLKLGRRAPSGRRAILFSELHVRAPEHPTVDPAPDLSFPMDDNDQWGDCVVAGWDHCRQVVTQLLTGTGLNYTKDQILAFYRTQNPDFDPSGSPSTNGPGSSADGGMEIQTFLEYLHAQGDILGFARVDPQVEADVKAAIYLGLGIVIGVNLDVAQQTQDVWKHVADSAPWGGHCVVWVGYTGRPDDDACVTWGHLLDMTKSFVTHQCDEAWFVITQAHLDNPNFRAGFDLAKFADAYTAITGKQWTYA